MASVDQLLDQKTAAKWLGLSVRTLERHRVTGKGPRYARLGRLIRYCERDLTEWVDKNSHGSISEPIQSVLSLQGRCAQLPHSGVKRDVDLKKSSSSRGS
jgi:predicted DNA-binding transcriptional regulator AlpA